jgi:large subunit ribosomal protein L18
MEETLMARGSTYRVRPRRRREGKTDYQARKALVLSGRPRLVVRNTLKNAVAQIIVAKPHGDEVAVTAHSRELKKYGWKAPTGNIPAAYLIGLLCGLKAKAKGVEDAILDIGLIAPTKGAKIFATLSGVLDAGVDVPHDEAKMVQDRIEGKHIVEYGTSLKEDSEVYSAKFSKYLAQKVFPEKLPEHIEKVKADIIKSFEKKAEKKSVKKSGKKA